MCKLMKQRFKGQHAFMLTECVFTLKSACFLPRKVFAPKAIGCDLKSERLGPRPGFGCWNRRAALFNFLGTGKGALRSDRVPVPTKACKSRRAAAGRAQLLAKRKHTGPALRCRPLAVDRSLTVWYFFLGAQGERQIL